MKKRQLKFTLTDADPDSPSVQNLSTFHPEGMRPASAIALRVSHLYGFACTVHENAGPTGKDFRVTFYDESTEKTREFIAAVFS